MLRSEQMTYVFIPGKNWKLSLAELVSFLKARNQGFKIIELSKSFFALKSSEAMDRSVICSLGGFIKIGAVVSAVSTKTMEEAVLNRKKHVQKEIKREILSDGVVDNIFEKSIQKSVFGVSVYPGTSLSLQLSKRIQRFLGSYIKENLKAQGIKAKFLGMPKSRASPQLTHVEVMRKELVDKSAEILLCIGRRRALIGKTIAVHDPFEFQKRDLERPVQRKIFSMPPRLARIMVNLSLCLPDDVLLDPFCGVGTILQEGMLVGAQIIGVDMDPWCVKATRKNLRWLEKEYSLEAIPPRVIEADSANLKGQIRNESIDHIITEPDLGPPLRHIPTTRYAQKIVDRLKPLYYGIISEAYRLLKCGGRLVLVTPYIKTRSETFVHLDVQKKAASMGFEPIQPFERKYFETDSPLIEDLAETSSFIDMKKEHKIGREIHILQK